MDPSILVSGLIGTVLLIIGGLSYYYGSLKTIVKNGKTQTSWMVYLGYILLAIGGLLSLPLYIFGVLQSFTRGY